MLLGLQDFSGADILATVVATLAFGLAAWDRRAADVIRAKSISGVGAKLPVPTRRAAELSNF